MTSTALTRFQLLEEAPGATTIRRVKHATVVEIVGDVTLYSSRHVRNAILVALDDLAVPQVIVDFSRVKYLDSSGIASLVECLLYSRKAGRRLSLCGLQTGPRQVLELTRLVNLFEVFDDVEMALSILPLGPRLCSTARYTE